MVDNVPFGFVTTNIIVGTKSTWPTVLDGVGDENLQFWRVQKESIVRAFGLDLMVEKQWNEMKCLLLEAHNFVGQIFDCAHTLVCKLTTKSRLWSGFVEESGFCLCKGRKSGFFWVIFWNVCDWRLFWYKFSHFTRGKWWKNQKVLMTSKKLGNI